MGWLTIILAIIQAIPTLIKIVEMIRDLLKDRSKEEKRVYSARLRGILKRWRETRDVKAATEELDTIWAELKESA